MVEVTRYPHDPSVANALKASLQSARTKRNLNVRSLIMFSGGLDSVALLANVLKETSHHVHVHHIEIVNKEGRDTAEEIAVQKTLDYIREHYRSFDYSSSRSEFMLGLGGGTDLQLALFTAGRVVTALQGNIDYVFTGHIQPPFWELSEGAAVFNAVFIHRRQKPEWLWPFSKINAGFATRKAHIYASIPEELVELTWSCRTPISGAGIHTPCGKCHACKGRATLPTSHNILYNPKGEQHD